MGKCNTLDEIKTYLGTEENGEAHQTCADDIVAQMKTFHLITNQHTHQFYNHN